MPTVAGPADRALKMARSLRSRGPAHGALDVRWNSLNALRLGLASAVVVSHAYPLGGFGPDPVLAGNTIGGWAVAGFFAISGYLIAGSRRRSTLKTYARSRFLRIFPGLWFCLLVIVGIFVPLSAHHGAGTPSLGSVLSFLTSNGTLIGRNYGIAGTLTTVPYKSAWDGSLWTLTHEVACYVLIGLLMLAPWFRRVGWLTVAVFVAFAALNLANSAFSFQPSTSRPSEFLGLAIFFLAGAALESTGVPFRSDVALAAALALALSILFIPWPASFYAIPFAYICLWLGVVLPLQRVGRVNDLSYGVYIYSFPVEQLISLYGGNAHGVVFYTLLALVLTFPFAAISWFAVEKPCLRRKRKSGRLLPADAPLQPAAQHR